MPLATAILGVALSIGLIFIATGFATVSSTTPLLAVMLVLAVGIELPLFIVSRHQDQTRAGMDPEGIDRPALSVPLDPPSCSPHHGAHRPSSA